MPRQKCDQVVSHRLELGTYERRQLAEAVDSYRKDKVWENIPNFAIGAASIVAGVGVVGIGYAGYKAAVALNDWAGGKLFDFVGDVKDGVDRVKNFPEAMKTWWYWRFYDVWPEDVVPRFVHADDPEHAPPPAPPEGEPVSPWSVVGMTEGEWLAAGGYTNPELWDVWVDWMIHHS